VTLLGQDLARLTEGGRTRLRRDQVGLIFQFFHLLPHLTVAENVALPGWIAGDAARPLRQRVAELLSQVGLDHRAGDRVGSLSGGEMQRVALCRALLRRPQVLLADEPTGNLDDATGRMVMDLLLRLAAEGGGSLVFVTHDESLAALADAIWHLHSGILEPG
jgi:predicted ABC-type transport system involved in lysophospholipase L1 biosynthesis ATPase subunit